MKLSRRRFLRRAAGAIGLLASPGLASAQAYPSHPITLVVPFPAGGPVDTLAGSWGSACGPRSASHS